MEKNNDKNQLGNYVIRILIGILLLLSIAYLLFEKYDIRHLFTTNIVNKTEKEVTVTDAGIADAVEKMYDATVIVEITSRGQIVGWGSGVVYKADDEYAYIITNAHVVDEYETVNIVFTNEEEVEGKVLGSDTYSDVAVIRVPAKSIINVAEIGTSTDLRVGDTVFAVGTPVSLQYSFTVTRGILSGKNRMVGMSNSSSYSFNSQSADSWYMSLLQIDASINSGNSGGPLANSNGELIGITNSKLSSSSLTSNSASIENIGFAIPIEDASSVAEQLIKSGSVTRPYLGISMTTVQGAEYNNIKISDNVTYGAVIADVEESSAADAAGLKKGDVIIAINDYKVEDYIYLKYYLYRFKIGDKIKVTYIRDGKIQITEVNLNKSQK